MDLKVEWKARGQGEGILIHGWDMHSQEVIARR